MAAHLCHNVAVEEIDALWSCEWGSGTCYHGGSEPPAAVGRICCYGIDLVRAVMVGWVFISDATSDEPRVSISPDAHKKITNIVVFYSDNSFQSFLPDL